MQSRREVSLRQRLDACMQSLLSIESKVKEMGFYEVVAQEIQVIRDFSRKQTFDSLTEQSVGRIEKLTKSIMDEIDGLQGKQKKRI